MNDYIFYYNDGAYITHRLSDEQYGVTVNSITVGNKFVLLDGFGVLYLDQLRAIVKQEELPPEEQSFTPDLTQQEIEWIQMMRQADQHFKIGDND